MAISVGDTLPDIQLMTMTAEGPNAVSMADFLKGKKTALFAVPGAFTPTCHLNHAPGYIAALDELKAKGVDQVACVSVNDVFVMDAWGQSLGAEGKLTLLADGSGEFTEAIGLELDATAHGLGVRSQRYAMIVDDGVVKVLNIESDPTQADASSAENLLKSF